MKLGRVNKLKRRWRLTGEGKAFIALACIVGLAAVNTGNNLVYLVFGFMLTVMLLSGVLSELSLRGLVAERHLPRAIHAGAVALMQIRLRNPKRWLSSYSIRVEESLQHSPGLASVPAYGYFGSVRPRQAEKQSYTIVFHTRGVAELTGVWLTTGFPFGLVEKSRFASCPASPVIYPRILTPDGVHRGWLTEGESSAAQSAQQGQEVSGVREYQRGDPASSIHWRRTAALGHLVVKDRPRQHARLRRIQIDPRCPKLKDNQWLEQFERRISQAAGLLLQALRAGEQVQIAIVGDGTYQSQPEHGPHRLLQVLAVLEPVPSKDFG